MDIVYNIFDGLIPVMFIFADSILYYTGIRSANTILLATCSKLCVVLVFFYISYLYIIKEKTVRKSGVLSDLIIQFILIVVLFVSIAIIIFKLE